MPGRRARAAGRDGEFVSRPRFLAISEFGPRSLIYHEGNRYEITRVILPPTERVDPGGEPVLTTAAKRCEVCGYLHPANGEIAADVCERCGAPLPPSVPGLFRLQNVATRRRDRISSDEEERRRQGFELQTAFRFAERNGVLSMRPATLKAADGEVLARLTYGDTATMWRLNLGRRRRANRDRLGFVLDLDKGTWEPDSDNGSVAGDDPLGPRTQRVVPFVEDTRNCLLFEPGRSMSAEQIARLQYSGSASRPAGRLPAGGVGASVGATPVCSTPLASSCFTKRPKVVLEYSGGWSTSPQAFAGVARTALRLCHFDDQRCRPWRCRGWRPVRSCLLQLFAVLLQPAGS